ncbi:hypothetical protein DFJ58DRAFT_759202 [Suillus subalutaceus]|uniref:uncharacterized protein n=1 Tax=Suillus subalutaceus TaxID=48586 RepID=UPI001B87ED4C|nr:uncharacterized protein DFJ58DRAFT_759202 [Suillus subalutaceus]KAG1873600.1 hypothetical protein DFJ58DRAFT_759202 [Suillus subalutaceus]
MDHSSDFALVEKRIRALTTILANMGHRSRGEPSFDLQQIPSLLCHFVNLLTPGDVFSPEVKKAIAVTGAIIHDGVNERFQTLVVTQNLYPRSSLTESKLEQVTKSPKSFQEIVNSNDDVSLNEHISEIWTALASFEPSTDNHIALSRFVINRCRRKVFTRIFLYQKTWHVDVAQTLVDWTPKANELPETHWLDAPHWFSLIGLPPDKDVPKRKQGPPDNQVTQLEFSSNTVHLWASFLGHLILMLERYAAQAQKMENEGDTLGFKTAMTQLSNCCAALNCFVSWDADVVKTLLTKTTLASKFYGFTDGHGEDEDLYDSDESDDLNAESRESSGSHVLRHLKGIVAWHAAIASLTTPTYSKIIRSELSLSLLEIPHASFDIANLDDIYEASPFNALFLSKSSIAFKDLTKSILKRNLSQTFSGTVHAEATLMGLLTYFSSSSSRVAFEMPLRDDHVAALDKLLEPATTENVVAVGRKCCWCCDRLRIELLGANRTRFKFPSSNGVIYPWSPPRVGVDVKVLQRLEFALFQELYAAISNRTAPWYRSSSDPFIHFSPFELRES